MDVARIEWLNHKVIFLKPAPEISTTLESYKDTSMTLLKTFLEFRVGKRITGSQDNWERETNI